MLFCYKDKNLFFLLSVIQGKPTLDPSTASPVTAYEPAQEAKGELEPLGSRPQGGGTPCGISPPARMLWRAEQWSIICEALAPSYLVKRNTREMLNGFIWQKFSRTHTHIFQMVVTDTKFYLVQSYV